MSKNSITNYADIVIIGGGIAGLWTLARLHQIGYQAILVEAKQLASMQTGASQGIIHGGTKYALTGKLTHSSQSIQQMPARWKKCLDGKGEVDLSSAKKLSEFQYLWSKNSLAAKLTGFFASKVMSSRMTHLSAADYIAPFNSNNFQGELYQLDEPVLDIESVIDSLHKQYQDFIFQFEVSSLSQQNDHLWAIKNISKQWTLLAQTVILTAGEGSEKLLSSCFGKNHPKMQRRPLLMPMLKAPKTLLPPLYAHCLGASALPKMTITSALMANHRIWYLGGEIAEQGVGRSIVEQVEKAKQALQKLMPWMDFSPCQWSALAINRAEPIMPDGSRPIEPGVFNQQGIISAWPVKLAMTPLMVDKIIAQLELLAVKKNNRLPIINHLSFAQTSPMPWEKVKTWIA